MTSRSFFELRIFSGVGKNAGPREQALHYAALLAKLRQRACGEASERGRFERFGSLPVAGVPAVLVGRPGLEEIRRFPDALLTPLQLVGAARGDEFDRFVQPLQAALERARQRIGRTGQPALEYAHGEAGRGPIQNARLVVGLEDVLGRRFVKLPLLRAQIVAERVAAPLRIQGPTVEMEHFLLGSTDEMTAATLFREGFERVEGGKRIGQEQPPKAVIGKILSHMRRRGQKQEVRRGPAEIPAGIVRGQAGHRFGETIPAGLANVEVLVAVGRQLVGFVEHDDVVGPRGSRGDGFAHPREHPLGRERVDADDEAIAFRPGERVSAAGVGAARDPELKAEQRAHLAFPVAHQPGRACHEDPGEMTARDHFSEIQSRHDRFSGAGVVRQQEAQRRLSQHVLVDRDSLMRKRVDRGNLRSERRIEKMPAREAMGLDRGGDGARIGAEVQLRRSGGLRGKPVRPFGFQIADPPPGQARRLRLPVLPPVHGSERHADALGELGLRQRKPQAQFLDANRVVLWNLVVSHRDRRLPPNARIYNRCYIGLSSRFSSSACLAPARERRRRIPSRDPTRPASGRRSLPKDARQANGGTELRGPTVESREKVLRKTVRRIARKRLRKTS